MKKHKLNFILPLVIYPFDVMISFGQTDKELKKILKSKGITGEKDLWQLASGTGRGRTCRFENGSTLIRLRDFPNIAFDYGVLNHEIFHAVCYIMDAVGMRLEIGVSDESYSYLIGYITEQVFLEIKKL